MAFKKDLYDPLTLSNSMKERFPIATKKAIDYMERNIDNDGDPKARDHALKIWTKMFDKFVPDPPKAKGEGSGTISDTLDGLLSDYVKDKQKQKLDNVIDAEVVDGEEEESS